MPSGVFLGIKVGLRGYLLTKKRVNGNYLAVCITSVLGVSGKRVLRYMRCFSCLVVCFRLVLKALRVFPLRLLRVLTAFTGVYYIN